MNNRAMTLALAIAAFAVYLVYSWVSEVEEKAQKRFGTNVLVLKAKRDIKETETINETMLTLESIPKTFLEPNAVHFEKKEEDQETRTSVKSLSGSVAIVPIKTGEQIAYNKITEPGIRTGLAPEIAPGRRAISIPVTEHTSVSKLIKPGNRVDLIAVMKMPGGQSDEKVVKTILQDVVVLAVGQNITNNIPRVIEYDGKTERTRSLNSNTAYTSVTLEVDRAQAQALTLIMSSGDNAISLSLRNNDDTERTNLGSMMMIDIIGVDVNRTQRAISGQRR